MYILTNRIVRIVCLSTIISLVSCLMAFGQADIPILAWQPQPDWINVKSAPYNAKGDATTDDANAINAAFDSLKTKNLCTIYFPAGTYKITRRIVMGTTGNLQQRQVLGCGRNTVIKWFGGTTDSVMFHPRGAWAGEFNGITWDGNNTAKIAIYHMACGFNYEGDIWHENQAFRNFKGTALKTVELNDPSCTGSWNPTAEIVIRNCLFDSCQTGVGILYYNEFNWNVEGCEFRNCAVGIRTKTQGYGFFRYNHFENSSQYDFQLDCAFAQTIRWCTSVGSRRFAYVQNAQISDCVISGMLDKDSAVILSSSYGPFVISDLFFEGWNSTKSPLVFATTASNYSNSLQPQKAVLSNIQCEGAAQPATLWRGGDSRKSVTSIPVGNRAVKMFAASKSFLKTSVPMPTGRVFNVTLAPFNAQPNNSTSQSAAIQRAIDSARTAGNNAMVYFPPGGYMVNTSVLVTGSDYFIMGTGISSSFKHSTNDGNPVFLVGGARNVVFANFGFRNDGGSSRCATCPAIKHIGSSTTGSFITYKRICTLASGYRLITDMANGLRFENLTAKDTVLMNMCVGELHIKNCGPAIIGTQWAHTTVGVYEGGTGLTTGFFGIAAANVGQFRLYNNINLVMGDLNIEESGNPDDPKSWGYIPSSQFNSVLIQGDAGSAPGRITIGGARLHSISGDTLVRINNYNGVLTMWGGRQDPNEAADKAYPTSTGYKFAPLGANPFYMVIAGTVFCGENGATRQLAGQPIYPKFIFPATDTFALMENIYGQESNIIPSSSLNKAALGLDDFRTLGNWLCKLDMDRTYSFPTGAHYSAHTMGEVASALIIHLTRAGLRIDHSEGVVVELFDVRGAMLYRSEDKIAGKLLVPVRKSAGTYLVRAISKHGEYVKKVAIW